MFGIGDQTFDSAKGLEALPNNVTIDIISGSLKITFVKFCKPLKKPPVRMGFIRWGLPKYLTGVSQVFGPHNRGNCEDRHFTCSLSETPALL